jgi:hypothetical protein
VRHPDRPEPSRRSELASLRERLDDLPASHPSSPHFTRDATQSDVSGQEQIGAQDDQPNPEPDGRLPDRAVERCGAGSVDQRARAFLPAELAIARALAVRGAAVSGLAEDHSLRQRQPDALVDGRVTEFKSLRPGASDATVKNQLRRAQGQAENVVIDARGSGLDEDSAGLGLRRFLGSPWAKDRYASILVLGDDYLMETASPRERRDE